MPSFRLPVSGLVVLFRQPAGAEDILLAEETTLDTRLALALAGALGRIARGPEGGSQSLGPSAVPWEALSITDLDAGLLRLRQMVLGDHLQSSVRCTECGARVDIAFRIEEYLAHHAPATPRGVKPADGLGWFRLDGVEGSFRLPSCADRIAISGRPDAERELARRCLRPQAPARRLRRRFEAAMEAMAPSLYGDLDGPCPECAATVHAAFDPQRYVLAELRERAAFVYEEVHLIAGHYRWSEPEILALPRLRRARYAELVSEARAGG